MPSSSELRQHQVPGRAAATRSQLLLRNMQTASSAWAVSVTGLCWTQPIRRTNGQKSMLLLMRCTAPRFTNTEIDRSPRQRDPGSRCSVAHATCDRAKGKVRKIWAREGRKDMIVPPRRIRVRAETPHARLRSSRVVSCGSYDLARPDRPTHAARCAELSRHERNETNLFCYACCLLSATR
jgi:hypothetical protein